MKKKYKSGLEHLTAQLLKDNGIKFTYEPFSLKFVAPVMGGWCSTCNSGSGVGKRRRYIPDFVVKPHTIVEAKGRLTSAERTKFLAIRASNPEWNIVFLFGSDNKLNKRKDRRYSDWCKDNGFDYGIKSLPPSLVGG